MDAGQDPAGHRRWRAERHERVRAREALHDGDGGDDDLGGGRRDASEAARGGRRGDGGLAGPMTGAALQAFTLFHVAISLVGIAAGLVVLAGMLRGRNPDGWTSVFLWTTVATSVTGFLFPFQRLLPSHVIRILSLLILALAIPARSRLRLMGAWRPRCPIE